MSSVLATLPPKIDRERETARKRVQGDRRKLDGYTLEEIAAHRPRPILPHPGDPTPVNTVAFDFSPPTLFRGAAAMTRSG
jgi:hypothetical protein